MAVKRATIAQILQRLEEPVSIQNYPLDSWLIVR